MTANQINYAKHLEGVRHNITEESETQRSNLAREAETARSNRQFELIGVMNANAALANAAANQRNAETNRYNADIAMDRMWTDRQAAERNAFTRQLEYQEMKRHNEAMEQQAHKSYVLDIFNVGSRAVNNATDTLLKTVSSVGTQTSRYLVGMS